MKKNVFRDLTRLKRILPDMYYNQMLSSVPSLDLIENIEMHFKDNINIKIHLSNGSIIDIKISKDFKDIQIKTL